MTEILEIFHVFLVNVYLRKWKWMKWLRKLSGILFIMLITDVYKQAVNCYKVTEERSCNRTRMVLTDTWGRITDGPNDYPKESHCEWLIKASSSSYYITLNITSMDTECSYDHLYIYDGASYDSYLLAVFSGKSSPTLVVAESGTMLILLYSDTNYMREGFEAEYVITELCPDNCGAHEGRGNCLGTQNPATFCHCEEGYTGDSCSLKGTSAKGDSWHWIYRNGFIFKPRTSHGTVYFPNTDQMYIFGGYNLNKVFDDLLVYNFSEVSWANLKEDESLNHSSRKRRIHSHQRLEILPSLQLFFDPLAHQKTKDTSRSHNMTFSVNSNNTVSVKLITSSDLPSFHRSPRMIQPNKEYAYSHQRKHTVWPAPRFGHCMESFGTDFVSYGGKLENGKVSSELWLYNASLGEWSLISNSVANLPRESSMPPPLLYCTLTLVDDEWLYLFGGGLSHGKFSNSMYRINPYRGWVWEKCSY
ncbi:Attractin [Armadillidium nasatum]|uniref:Attractin n=1 Tax=Armadillidium nasatum TaxID=96803 RepID=A0A5N5TL46_9CRUS|nr:Attractin [Armadillidium nasatum]